MPHKVDLKGILTPLRPALTSSSTLVCLTVLQLLTEGVFGEHPDPAGTKPLIDQVSAEVPSGQVSRVHFFAFKISLF